MFLLQGKPTERVHDAMLREAARLESLAADLRAIGAGTAPIPADLADAPVISNWRRATRPVPCVVGLGSGHPRVPDGPVTTIDLWAADPTAGWVRTLGRYYVLGPCAEAPSLVGRVGHA
jgi:hypothetical protein